MDVAVATLRKQLGLSLAEFAAVVGVNKNTVWRWEYYGQTPRARAILDRLAALDAEGADVAGLATIKLRATATLIIDRLARDVAAARAAFLVAVALPPGPRRGAAAQRAVVAREAAEAVYMREMAAVWRRTEDIL
jgi:transcriptional regulator with XRE-family HTH domain